MKIVTDGNVQRMPSLPPPDTTPAIIQEGTHYLLVFIPNSKVPAIKRMERIPDRMPFLTLTDDDGCPVQFASVYAATMDILHFGYPGKVLTFHATTRGMELGSTWECIA